MSKIEKNEQQKCSVQGCDKLRYGYSKYCLKHRSHYNSTGDVNQIYLKKFYEVLKPTINEVKDIIIKNKDEFHMDLHMAKLLMNNPKSYFIQNSVINYLADALGIRTREYLTPRAIKILKTYRYDEVNFLARVIAVYLFHTRNPVILKSGRPLYLHIGKSIWYGCALTTKISQRMKVYKKREELSFRQLLLIGAVLSSKLEKSILYFLKKEREKNESYK